jgi:predicted ATPase
MVSELSTIILILKHAIDNSPLYGLSFNRHNSTIKESNRKTLLFIEEPEAHLHPEVQLKLMKIFADLIVPGIKLVITSHSDYMFNQLNNMILDHKVDPKRIGIYHMINTPKGSIVNPEVQATEEGMMDENFSQTAIKLYEERMEILERQNSMVL